MIRRIAPRTTSSASLALVGAKRTLCCPILCNITSHLAQVGQVSTLTTAAALPYTPIATVAYVALAYNVCVGLTTYTWFVVELAIRDYTQDVRLHVLLRYMLMVALLLCAENVLIEA